MSKPTTRLMPAAPAVFAMPTIPPAGPERIAFAPLKAPSPARPPLDCMNIKRVPGSSLLVTCRT